LREKILASAEKKEGEELGGHMPNTDGIPGFDDEGDIPF